MITHFLGPKRKESDPNQSGPGPSRPRASREPGGVPEHPNPLRVGRGDLDPFGGFSSKYIHYSACKVSTSKILFQL